MRAAVFALACVAAAFAGDFGEARLKPGRQQPRIINGRLVPQAAGSGLDATFRRLVGRADRARVDRLQRSRRRKRRAPAVLQRRYLDLRRHRLQQRPAGYLRTRTRRSDGAHGAGPAGAQPGPDPARGARHDGRPLPHRREGRAADPDLLAGLRAGRGRADDPVARRRQRRRLREAARDVRREGRGEVRPADRRRDQRDRDAQGRGGRRRARALRSSDGQSRIRPQEGDVLDGQRARPRAGSRR